MTAVLTARPTAMDRLDPGYARPPSREEAEAEVRTALARPDRVHVIPPAVLRALLRDQPTA